MRSTLRAGLWLASMAFCAWTQPAGANSTGGDGSTPLHWAVYRDELQNAEALLRAGADAKAATRYGVTPLSLACTNGNAAMIELLLKAGADANATLPGGETALMTAARTGNADAVLVLLRHGADVNAKENWRGQTALMGAAAEGHAAAVKVLLEHGADMHARSRGAPGRGGAGAGFAAGGGDANAATATPAAAGGSAGVPATAGASPGAPSTTTRSAGAASLATPDAPGTSTTGASATTPATAGASPGAPSTTTRSAGAASLATPDAPGTSTAGASATTPATAGASTGTPSTTTPATAGTSTGTPSTTTPAMAGTSSAGATRVLAAADAASSMAGGSAGVRKAAAAPRAARTLNTDFTPFLFAVRGGHIDTVKVLLAAGADPNEALADGTSALVLAVTDARYELGALLIEKGANPNADAQGWTALHQVAWTRRPNIHKTPAAVPSGNMDSLTFVKFLIAHGADPNARETKEPRDGNLGKLKRIGATAYLLAAKSADTELMRCLMVNGADTRLMTAEKVTPLEAAAGVGVYRVSESPGSNEEALEAAKLAYELGSRDVNWVDDNGNTAMHGAALRGSNAIVQFLFDKGAKMDVTNKIGWTPLTIAEGVFYPDVFKTEAQTEALLLKLGATKREVPESVRYAGLDKDGRETTVGGGGDAAAPAKPTVDASKPAEVKN